MSIMFMHNFHTEISILLVSSPSGSDEIIEMARTSVGKHKSTKFVLVCVGLLGFALIADLFWASSSSSAYMYLSSNWPLQQSHNFLPPHLPNNTATKVHSHVDVYNLTENTWGGRFDMPKEMAHSHLGMVTDGRYIYVVTGQYGPQCRGPTARTFVLDTETKKWQDMPNLPVPRYAPATQLWKGRLHVMGGSKENRHTPGLEHWSLGVKDGKALEKEWRSEIPIPRGGPHRACVVANDRLYIIGGQEGDFMAKPGSPIYKCSRRNEKWSVVGKLPYRVKTTLVGFWNGWLYFTSGQRDRGPDNPAPSKVIGEMWRTKLHL
ncbi:hypothetical protein Vadar_027580 [Vaccinium darrowii]|uniref:Uncharacterized protein n=1 Tax=Vaccinium darrowii TaxID=229202 RepID=A0ACB7ZM84_9ERIC|nr:hypothetical protein Vadar_027580 [Vaccinium darrowii]